MSQADRNEFDEALEFIDQGEDMILLNLTKGDFVLLSKEKFDNIVNEVNDSRVRSGNLEEGVELIIISEKEEDENTETDS